MTLTRLVVFSDDWGRHPSSCQHLVGQLLPSHPALWVNTIGTRLPSLTLDDLRKVIVKLQQWTGKKAVGQAASLPANLQVTSPRMWPGFRTRWQRSLNRKWIAAQLSRTLGPREPGERRVLLTTIPLTADLIASKALDVDASVYYCVDDFSVWPGLDGPVMQEMEKLQVQHADAVVCVSELLQERVQQMGRADTTLLTHGIDLQHWTRNLQAPAPDWWSQVKPPVVLFWGLIDARLDLAWCRALTQREDVGTLVVVGPEQGTAASELRGLPRTLVPGAMDYADLPALAAKADVLVMPYADLPVTRAMQPLKFKEYLATHKPVVARLLPSNKSWVDAADLEEDPRAFVDRVLLRLRTGIPEPQRIARQRLGAESWTAKAAVLRQVIEGLAGQGQVAGEQRNIGGRPGA